MDDYPVTPHGFDGWTATHQPAVASLLQELRERVLHPPQFPASGPEAIAPLSAVLAEARNGIPVNDHGYARRGYGERRNRELGFESQDLPEAPDDLYLELDALLMVGFAIGALDTTEQIARMTPYGRHLLADPVQLWTMAHRSLAMMAPQGPAGELWFPLLPWLLAEAPFTRMSDLLAEIPEPNGPDPDGGIIFLLYTYLRALGMFVPRSKDVNDRPPVLSESGKAGVIEALRMLASVHQQAATIAALN